MVKKIKVNINELTKQKGISLRELSRLTDIRHAALNELANQKNKILISIKSKKLQTHWTLKIFEKSLT
jgi:DNA-binding Xre family transcriptional regulator